MDLAGLIVPPEGGEAGRTHVDRDLAQADFDLSDNNEVTHAYGEHDVAWPITPGGPRQGEGSWRN